MENNIQEIFTIAHNFVMDTLNLINDTIETILEYFKPQYVFDAGMDSNGIYFIEANSKFELDVKCFERKMNS